MDDTSDDEIRDILLTTRRIAVVGASDRPGAAELRRGRFLPDRGYAITPVNPGIAGRALHGAAVVARLEEARRRSTWWTCSAAARRPARWWTRRSASARAASGCSSA